MGLREQAALDLRAITEDDSGFGWPITVTSDTGVSASTTGLSTDIGHTIDPETGVAVAGRQASVAIAIATLTAAGLGLPRGIADQAGKPWRVTFNDIRGTSHTFKVSRTMPDLAIGIVVCMLEHYKQA